MLTFVRHIANIFPAVMKEFLKYTLATVTGIVLVGVVMVIVGIVSIAGMAVSSQNTTEVKDNSVLVLRLSGALEERQQDDIMAQLTGTVAANMGLEDILSAIRKAKDNDNIKGIYIEAGLFDSDSPASSQAIRKQLADFKKSGKWIVSYADTYTQTTYYICSVADEVCINPQGMIDWHGLAATPIFYKDLLAKFGVKMQLSKVGKYKSAPETYTADKMSDPNREQVQAYINGIWDVMVSDVAKSRKKSKAQLNSCADSLITFAPTESYVKLGLVDKTLYTDEVKGEIKRKLGIDSDDDINQLTVSDMNNQPDDNDGDEIAIYYAYGSVVDGATSGLTSEPCIAADVVCADLEELADDDDVKAVVLRVNSGGGSAYASEQIWHAVKKLKEKKPVVVSMGGMAASGGYYLSCAANYIYAEPTTLTGSIGIFGMFPDVSGLLTDKLGIKFDEVKTNRHSAFGTPSRPFNAEEMALVNGYVERGYQLFLKRVAEGRHLTVENVDAIAQGRVWLGRDASTITLVDGLGGIYDAVEKAAQLAKVGDYHTEAYPAAPTWMEQLLAAAGGSGSYLDEQMQATLGDLYEPFSYLKSLRGQSAIQARMPYNIIIR